VFGTTSPVYGLGFEAALRASRTLPDPMRLLVFLLAWLMATPLAAAERDKRVLLFVPEDATVPDAIVSFVEATPLLVHLQRERTS
jgi:hypothetical protein